MSLDAKRKKKLRTYCPFKITPLDIHQTHLLNKDSTTSHNVFLGTKSLHLDLGDIIQIITRRDIGGGSH